jgi:diguanylate cyclase (GGDEF)-like protein
VVGAASSAGSGLLCFTAYYLLGVALFPPGTVGWILFLAPLVTPLAVAPAVALPWEKATRRTQQLLAEVEKTRSQLAAEVAERKAAQARLEDLVRRDPLTGLLNRRGFFERWGGWPEAEELVLITVDADRFKDVNDTAGHAAGDAVLRAMADRLRSLCGERACVARIGGDEFAVVAPAADELLAAKVRQGLSNVKVELADGRASSVSASIGVAPLVRGASLDDAMAQADQKMYTSKRSRRPPRERSDNLAAREQAPLTGA